MPASQEAIKAALSSIKDPYLGTDLVSAEAIKSINLEGNAVHIEIELGFPVNGFAAEVTERNRFLIDATPPVKRGDIIYAVEKVFEDEIANTPELHIKLRHRAGSKVKLHVLRDQEKFISELTCERQNFRKIVP